MLKRRVMYVVSLFILLAGCASTPQLNSEARAHVGAVRIDAAIDTPSEMYYSSQASALGVSVFGAIGGGVGVAIDESRGGELDRLARDNGIHIDLIVREEAGTAFQQSGKLNLTDVKGADVATLKISITMYGFSVPTGFTSELVPIVGIKCTLVDSTGKTIWSANQSTHPLGNPVAGKTRDQFLADPKLIDASWRAATKSVMADIVSHM